MKRLAKPILKKIQDAYGFSCLEIVNKVEVGYLSHNFIVSNGKKKFFLKQHRHKSMKTINKIFLIEDFFSSHGIPVINPLVDKEGERVTFVAGDYYSLFSFIRAKQINRKTTSRKSLVSTARYLAKIHKLSKKYKPNLTTDKLNDWSTIRFNKKVKEIEKALAKSKGDKYMIAISKELLSLKQDLVMSTVVSISSLKLNPSILVHGDYHLNNIFFSTDDSVKYIFDWEKSVMASRYFELIRAVDLICFGTVYNKVRWKKALLFIKEYHKVLPIKANIFKNEMKNYYLRKIHATWLLDEYYLKNNKRIACLIPKEIYKLEFYRDFHKILSETVKVIIS